MKNDLRKEYSIIVHQQFASSREALNAAQIMLKKKGKGNKPHAAEPLEREDFDHMWEKRALGDQNGEVRTSKHNLAVAVHAYGGSEAKTSITNYNLVTMRSRVLQTARSTLNSMNVIPKPGRVLPGKHRLSNPKCGATHPVLVGAKCDY